MPLHTTRSPLLLTSCLAAIARRPSLHAAASLFLAAPALLRAADDSVRVEDFTLAEVHPIMSEANVQVDGFSLVPMAYHEGLVQLHPKAALGVAYDSNVFATNTDVHADEYLNALAGVEGEVEISDTQRAYTDCEVEGRLYRTDYNQQELLAHLYAQYDQDFSNASQMEVTGTYNRTDDPLVETGYEVDHGEALLGAQYSYDGLASRYTLRFDYENDVFYTGDSFFTPPERNSNTVRVTGVYGFRKGEASEFVLRLAVDDMTYTDPDPFQSSNGFSALVGWRGLASSKISMVVAGGLELREFQNNFDDNPEYNDKEVARPVGIVNLKYDLEDSSFVALRAYSQMEPSEISNAVWYYGVGINARYRLLINSALIGGAEYYHGRESGSVAGVPLEQRDTGSLNGGLEYFLREGIGARFTLDYDDSRSKDYNSFTRVVAKAEMAFAY